MNGGLLTAAVSSLLLHAGKGGLDPHDLARLNWLLAHLQQMYARHIAEEDNVIFPLAEQLLPAESLAAIGREMAERRGLSSQPLASAHG